MRRSIRALLVVAVPSLVAACSRDKSHVGVSFSSDQAAQVAAEPLGPGDVRITSTDNSVLLGVIGDSVVFQLSDSLRNSVSKEIKAAGDSAGGFGGMITRSVSGMVGSAMGFVVHIPVKDVKDVRYVDGRIEFETTGKNSKFSMSGSNSHEGGRDHGKFSQADGERFVNAVKARQAALGQ